MVDLVECFGEVWENKICLLAQTLFTSTVFNTIQNLTKQYNISYE